MADFTFITDRLATGAAVSSAEDVEELVRAGVTHVIDCRGEFDDMPLFAKHPELAGRYLWNGVSDDGQAKPPSWFQRSLEFALPVLALPHNKVYCHCAAGVNRGPSTCFAIMRALGFTHLEADTLIRIKRPVTVGGIRYADDADFAIRALGYC